MSPTLTDGMRVRVHLNLTRLTWSVMVKVKGKGWRLARHMESLTILDATPIYHTSRTHAIRRAWEEEGKKKREICARLEGIYTEESSKPSGRVVTFNPYRRDDFHHADDSSTFTGAPMVHFPRGERFVYTPSSTPQ